MDEYENYNFNSSSLGKVILRINQMCKKPTIEAGLSEQVDLFAEKLHESNKYLENGIFNVNFTEAALFVQSATELYGKKVDLLWDNILEYQKRMILYEKKHDNQEIDKLEERMNRGKRKKIKILHNQPTVDPIKSLFKESDLHEIDTEHIDSVFTNWCNNPKENIYRTGESDVFATKYDTSHADNFSIYDDDQDILYDEPNITLKRWHGMGILNVIYNLYDKGVVNDLHGVITKIRTDVDLEYKFRVENEISPEVCREKIDPDLRDWVRSYIMARRANISMELENIRQKLCPADTIINLHRLPTFLVKEKLPRKSLMDYPPDITSSENSSNMIEDLVPEKTKPLEVSQVTVCLEKEQDKDLAERKLSQDSGFFDMTAPSDDFDCGSPHELEPQVPSLEPIIEEQAEKGVPEPENVSLNETESTIIEEQGEKECVSETENVSLNETEKTIIEEQAEKEDVPEPENVSLNGTEKQQENENEVLNPVDVTIEEVVNNYPREKRKKEKFVYELEDVQKFKEKKKNVVEEGVLDTPLKRRKLTKKQIEKLSIPIKESKMSTFEKFYSMNYTAETDEGVVEEYEYESDFDNEDREDFLDLPSAETEFALLQEVPEKETNKDVEETNPNTNNNENNHDSVLKDNTPAVVPETAEPCSSKTKKKDLNMGPTKEDIAQSRENVKKWKDTIMPKLRALKNAEFDIHNYGSQIMEPLEVNQVTMFKDIVKQKPSAEVVRYFISSLQLANTYNIEIGGAQKGKLSNDTFNLKLLTKERYHEHLNDYEAPSVENFRDKIEKVHKLQDAKEKTNKRQKVSH